MSSYSVMVARRLKAEIGGGFKSLSRERVTAVWRDVAGDPTARMGRRRVEEVEQALLEQGVRCVPALSSGAGVVRLIRAGTLASDIAELVLNPSTENDRELARIVTKVKGRWDYGEDERASA